MRVVRSVLLAAVAVFALESFAFAATPEPKIEDVTFTDADRLTTSSLSANETVVKGGPKTIRIILTRPRTTFVPEMLASIQNL